jgi:tetratricopeptide (TPR) repeat protein
VARRLLVVALCLVALAGPSFADDTRPSVAVFLLHGEALPAPQRANLLRALDAALKQNQHVEAQDKDLVLAEVGGEIPEAKVAKARALFAEGAAALEAGDGAAAVAKLSAAEAAFEPVLAFVKKNELADAQWVLGAAHAAAGDKKKARAAFARLQTWRSGYEWDTGRYAELQPLWQGAREDVAKAGRGSIEVVSEPEGAMAFVDGKYVGVTPARADGLPAGDHYVTLKLDGYQRRVVKAHVDPRYQELVTETLAKSGKYAAVEQALARVEPALGREQADPAMLELRGPLRLDLAVFVRVSPGRVDAFLYDLRSKRRLSQVLGAELGADVDATAQTLVSSLFAGVGHAGPLVARTPSPAPTRSRPLYKKPWFWVAVGVGAALVATPIVFSDELFGDDGPTCSTGSVCTGVITGF